VCSGDLAREGGVIVGDIRSLVHEPVLELDIHPFAELLDVEGGAVPVDADLDADTAGLLGGETLAIVNPLLLYSNSGARQPGMMSGRPSLTRSGKTAGRFSRKAVTPSTASAD
jgi:hypothetical protein